MRCRLCHVGLLLAHTSDGVKGGDVLRFSCGHQSRIFPHHEAAGRCLWCGAFLPTYAPEIIHGHTAPICGRPGCSDLDSWMASADDEAQVILDAAQAMVDEIAREHAESPPEPPDYLLRLFGPREAPESPPEPSTAPNPTKTPTEAPESPQGPSTGQDPPRPHHTIHSPSHRPRCEASTMSGDQCGNRARAGSLFCGVHRQAWEAIE